MTLGEAIFTILCWVLGFIGTAKTDWMVRQARALQNKYPRAFTTRLPDRKWYPAFLRTMSVFLLLCASLWTAKFVLSIWPSRLIGR